MASKEIVMTPEEAKQIAAAVAAIPATYVEKCARAAIDTALEEFARTGPATVREAVRDLIAQQVRELIAAEFKSKIEAVVRNCATDLVSKMK